MVQGIPSADATNGAIDVTVTDPQAALAAMGLADLWQEKKEEIVAEGGGETFSGPIVEIDRTIHQALLGELGEEKKAYALHTLTHLSNDLNVSSGASLLERATAPMREEPEVEDDDWRIALILRAYVPDTIVESLCSKRGNDQDSIAQKGLAVIDLLLRKNMDYGSSVWRAPCLMPHLPPSAGILVRMSDKLHRIMNLSDKSPEVAEENLAATMLDLAGYAILYLVTIDKDQPCTDMKSTSPPHPSAPVA